MGGYLKFLFLLLLSACSDQSTQLLSEADLPAPTIEQVDYDLAIRPIIEKKCIACHGCFDAPCQLKMETTSGLVRGASKLHVYNGLRKTAAEPTRLTIDAESESEWRALDFHSVFEPKDPTASLLYRMLTLGKQNHFPENSKLPESIELGIRRENSCPRPDEFDKYAEENPKSGMPFAISGLTDKEFSLIRGWLLQGAVVPNNVEKTSNAENVHIQRIEEYLNQKGAKVELVSRWLYEHLFLAHLYFDRRGKPEHFFELVRSYSPPGEPVDVVRTRLPNDKPNGNFFYRLRLIEGAIVHKRHITFLFDEAVQKRIDSIFYDEKWSVKELPNYNYENKSNPFLTYQAIPAQARYQFLLDHAEYFTRTFIRGPVCRGQIATDVIRDQFWVMYQSPEQDLFITDSDYRKTVIPLLGLPGQDDNIIELPENWDRYKTKRNRYLELRNQRYKQSPAMISSTQAIWNGDGHNENAFLTVFRHFDSASVKKGFIGEMPHTLWWMDFPLFERTYYELVVNFDVFGNVAHQLQTRLYFDLIRNGAEHNFLRLVPKSGRTALLDFWYQGMGAIKTDFTYAPLDTDSESGVKYSTKNHKRELIEMLLTETSDVNAMSEDNLNRCETDCFRSNQAPWLQAVERSLSSLTKVSFAQENGLHRLPEVTFIHVKGANDEKMIYTLLRNRYHDNVAFLLGESLRYQAEKDTLTLYPGVIGSYPNFMFTVAASEVDSFRRALLNAKDETSFNQLTARWGVRRTHPNFWDILHDISAWQSNESPFEAGIFDVNRYQNL